MPGLKYNARNAKRLKIGKKRAIYLPKVFLEKLGLKEGDPVIVELVNNSIVIKGIKDPLLLGAKGRKWSSTTVEEFESEEEQESWKL